MHKLNIRPIVIFATLEAQLGILTQRDDEGWTDQLISDDTRVSGTKIADALERSFGPLGFVASTETMIRWRQAISNPDTTYKQLRLLWGEYKGRLLDEIKATSMFSIDPNQERLFTGVDHFGPTVASVFTDAQFDIEEAARCLALDRSTASVFHVMRVLEIALQRFGTKIGLASVDKNWQTLLNNVRGQVNRLPQNTDPEKEYHAQASEILAHLQAVKDAWRNATMHPRSSYTPEQAREVWTHAKPLAIKIAEFI